MDVFLVIAPSIISVLSAAAVSNVPVHSAIMVNSHGGYINSQSYDHTGETE